jgi:adenylate cyclase
VFIISWFSNYSVKTILATLLLINTCFAASFVDFAKVDGLENITNLTKIIKKKRSEKINPLKNIFPNYYIANYANTFRAPYTDEVLWGKIDFINSSNKTITKRYFWDTNLTGFLSLYFKGVKYDTGSSVPLGKRNEQSIYSSLKLTLEPMEKETLYFKRESQHALSTKIYLANELDYHLFKTDKENSYRYYVGAIAGLFFYNLLLVLFLRSKKYLIYCIFILSFLITILNLHGVLDNFDVFESTTFSYYLSVTTIIAIYFGLSFGFIFLEAKVYLKEFYKLRKAIIVYTLFPLILIPTPLYESYGQYFGYYIDINIFVALIFLMGSCIIAIKRKAPLAKVYLISWSFIFGGSVLHFGNIYNFFPKNFLTENGFLFGNLFEMIILSLGLAYQAAILDKETQKALIKAQGKEKYQHLLRTISHDISNSMQVLIIGAKRLKKISDNERVFDVATKIQVSTKNVVEILEQIKMQEKYLQDKESIVLSKVNLPIVLNELIIIFEDALIEKNIILKFDIPQAHQVVLAERVTLKNNVLGNIISNSIKFSPAGSEINFTTQNIGNKIQLTIRDFGNGFSEEALQFINEDLDMTFSTPGTKGEKGTGFGLRIIKSYVKMYHGDLRAFNDNGAVFELTFQKSNN